MEFNVGDSIWIYPHDELEWAPGEVVEVRSDGFVCICREDSSQEPYFVEKQFAVAVHPSCHEGLPDLLQLGELNEGALLNNVRVRYFRNQIYSSVGAPIIISINPYCKLPIYSADIAAKYRIMPELAREGREGELEPHLFGMAEAAYSRLREGNQAIIISGESGAGKTESAKIILRHLANICSDKAAKGEMSLEQKVLDSNPILEAFGNAKTLRNDNSSRFGKFLEVHFDPTSLKLRSARIESYLLEKSRIVTQATGERNYHVFYQLCSGLPDEESEMLRLGPADTFAYLSKGDCLEVDGVDDAEEFHKMRLCMAGLGMTPEEIQSVFEILAAILHMGNIEVEERNDAAILSNPEELEFIAGLLRIAPGLLEKVILKKVIIDPSNKQQIEMDQSSIQASYNRDAACKALYSRLFSWLIARVNASIAVPVKGKSRILGLLDIYGFEVFQENSFEQFCINYANEKLQQHFNSHMFKTEQAEYSKEKIRWDHIEFVDNQVCLDLIEGKPLSIIALLDEQCRLPAGSDNNFLAGVNIKLKANECLKEPDRFANQFFGIQHYAGDVFYKASNFVEKNKDSVGLHVIAAFKSSTQAVVARLFDEAGAKPKDPKAAQSSSTLASQFKEQLHNLMKTLSASTPCYVRCIKPNANKAQLEFDSEDVMRQLSCAGMLESIRIRKAGYSVRRKYPEFINKYRILTPKVKILGAANAIGKSMFDALVKLPALKDVLDPAKLKWQLGVTKVYMKDDVRLALDTAYSEATRKQVTRIQKVWKGFKARQMVKKLKAAIKKIQTQSRVKLLRIKLRKLANKVRKVKACLKGWINRVRFLKARRAATFIKLWLRFRVKKIIASGKKMNQVPKLAAPPVIEEDITIIKPIAPPKLSQKLDFDDFQFDLNETFSAQLKKMHQSEEVTHELYIKKDFEVQLATLREELRLSRQENEDMRTQFETEKEQLLDEIHSHTMRHSEANRGDTTELKKKIRELEAQNSSLNVKLQTSESSLSELQRINKKLTEREQQLRQQREADLKEHSAKLAEVNSKLKEAHSSGAIGTLEREVTRLKKEKESLNDQVHSLSFEVTLMKEKLADALYSVDEAAQLKEVIQHRDAELRKLKQNLNSQKENQTRQQFQEDIFKLNEQIGTLNDKIDELETECARLQASETSYKEEYNKKVQEALEKQSEIERLEEECTNQHNSILTLQSQLSQPRATQSPESSLLTEIYGLSEELAAAKKASMLLVSLLKFKNIELEQYKRPNTVNESWRKELERIRQQEKVLLEKLNECWQSIKPPS